MNRSFKISNIVLAALLAVGGSAASAADKVTVQLKWLPQAQFAGYYVAQAKPGQGLLQRRGAGRDHQTRWPRYFPCASHCR